MLYFCAVNKSNIKRLFGYSIFVILLLVILASIIRVEVYRHDSKDKQYSVITKGSLLNRFTSRFSISMPGDGTSFEEGKVLVIDNKEGKVIEKFGYWVKVRVEFKTDTVSICYSEFCHNVKLPRKVEE